MICSNLQILLHRINHMESTLYLEKIKMPSSRLNLLDAKAEHSIKRHNVRGFINAGSGTSTVAVLENDQNSQLAEHLMHLKTSCSGVKVDIKHREWEQYRVKDETNFIREKVKAIQTERQQLEDKISKLKGVVEQAKGKQMNAMLTSKSYEHILDRMKKDQIRYQIKKNQLEKELKALEKVHKQLKNKNYQLKEYSYMSTTGLKEAQNQIEELKNFRKTTLMNMSRVVDQKEVLERKKLQRKEKSDMIKEMAAGDLQDAELIQLKKFLAVQTFLKTLLKGKISKLKQFYEPYELAFIKIKGNTNVKDANSLKSQFHNFEVSFNQKSAWVSHLEEQISKSEQTRKQLTQELSNLKLKQMEILEQLEQDNEVKQACLAKELQKKAADSQIMMTSVRQWLKQQSKRMGIDSSNKSEILLFKELSSALKKSKEASQAVKSKSDE